MHCFLPVPLNTENKFFLFSTTLHLSCLPVSEGKSMLHLKLKKNPKQDIYNSLTSKKFEDTLPCHTKLPFKYCTKRLYLGFYNLLDPFFFVASLLSSCHKLIPLYFKVQNQMGYLLRSIVTLKVSWLLPELWIKVWNKNILENHCLILFCRIINV